MQHTSLHPLRQSKLWLLLSDDEDKASESTDKSTGFSLQERTLMRSQAHTLFRNFWLKKEGKIERES